MIYSDEEKAEVIRLVGRANGRPKARRGRVRSSHGCVYAVEREPGMVKIGVSRNPDKRIRELSLQGGFTPLRTLATEELSNAAFVERAAHRVLAEFRVMGEWFRCSIEAARAAIETAKDAAESIDGVIADINREGGALVWQAAMVVDYIQDTAEKLAGQAHGAGGPNDALCFDDAAKAVLAQELESLAEELLQSAFKIRCINDFIINQGGPAGARRSARREAPDRTATVTGIEKAIAAAGTQTKLAERLGVTQQSVSLWLKQGCVPTDYVGTIATAYAIPRVELINPKIIQLVHGGAPSEAAAR